MKKRILALLLAMIVLVGTLPVGAFATEATDPTITLCETEGCEYASGHEGDCSNYVAPTEGCATEGCTYGVDHEGNCSNFVEPSADETAAQQVMDLIAAIGEVTLESEAAIAAADAAYNNLTDAQKVLVTNLDVLEAAKNAFGALSVPVPATDPAADAVVSVTVNKQGVLALVNKSVTVKDSNADGVLTYHEALEAAHTAYCPDGYTASNGAYGIQVDKLWGVSQGTNYLFFKNGTPLNMNVGDTTASTVAEGDRLYISVNADNTYYADWYTYFDKTDLTVDAGAEFTLTLKGYLGMGTTSAAKAVSGVTVGTWNSGSFTAIEGKTTDSSGQVTLSFDKAGIYYVSASGTVSDTVQDWSNGGAEVAADCPIMPPVSVVMVEETEEPATGLSKLQFTSGSKDTSMVYTLSPAFDAAVKEYTLIVPDSTASIYAWATLADGVSDAITVDYTNTSGSSKTITLTSGKTSGASISSAVKSGTFDGNTLTVTVGDVIYTVNIQRQATLSKLAVTLADESAVTLSPAFSATTATYTAKIPHDAVLTVAPTVKTTGAAVVVSGTAEDGTVTPVWEDHASKVTVTVSAEGAASSTYTINFQQQVTTIEIQKPPAKTTYKTSEHFDPAGMELKATYADGSTITLLPENVTFTPTEALTPSISAITVTYDGLSVQQPITVNVLPFAGAGTADSPYLIKTAEDLATLSWTVANGLSFAGEHFRMTADITLPDNWTPLGVDAKAPFSGNFDGSNHLLTVPEDGLPLIGTPKGASLTNLNVYGSKIAGYGVVNNYCEIGKTHAITIENVTLKSGTQTLQAGFIGGYASGSDTVTIRNCTVEKGVVIGYDKSQKWVGSFAGEFNGTIENCVSYATVYGTDFVGGIVSNKGQSMGTFTVSNCNFYGNVTATGNFVGGIVGHGYGGTKWGFSNNAGIPTISNCTATGSVTGANYVGGIYGGDIGVVQVWDNAAGSVAGNRFTGTVSATGEYVGAIIGYLKSLNKNNVISNNYYARTCGASKGIGGVEYVDTSCETHETDSGATYVNTANGKPGITGFTKTNLNRTDDPLGADAANLCYTDVRTAADPVDVTMTVSNKGTLALVNGTVTVKDTNTDGILTYHEALEAAHAAYCSDGYTATESEWGISVSEIWGVETYNSLYFRNGEKLANHVGNTETSTVAEGDSLLVSVNKDDTYYSDRYSSFNTAASTVVVGSTFTLTLKADLSSGSAVVPNVTIGTWSDGVFTPLEGMTTDASGKVKLSFAEVGTYIVSASGTVSDTVQDWSNGGAEVTADCPIIAPVCVVKVVDVPYFSNLDLYKSSSDYTNGAEPLEITPAFEGTTYDGYSVQVPDYLKSVYAVGTLSEQTMNSDWTGRVMYSNNWGGWTGVSLVNGITKGSSVFSKGYVSIYLDSRNNGEYKIDVTQYATLKGLTIDGVVDKDFDRDITIYHAYVDGTAKGVAITPTAYKTGYTIRINGTEVTGGEAYTLPYSWGENGKMNVTIEVSGSDVTASTYTVELEKQPLNDAPFIMKESTEADYTTIDTKVADLFVEASANGDMTYQWYYNTTASNKNGTIIEGAVASTYTPPITKGVIGTRYYYCVITNTGKTEGNVTTSTATRITVDPDPTPVVTFNNPGEAMPEDGYEYPWNTGYVYKVGSEATPLTITATSAAEGGEWSYKWWNKSSAYTSSYSTATGETSGMSYIPNTSLSQANDAGRYYACQVSYTFKGKTYTSWAKTGETYTDDKGKTYDVVAAYVFLKVDEAAAPEITTQPKSASYIVGDSMTALSAGANRADGGKLTYQWYENTTNSTEGGTAIEGATRNSYSLGTASEGGTKYYYCVVTNTIQGYTASATSTVAEITVKTVADVLDGKLKGSGTQEDPCLIENAQDYQDVYDLVAKGMSFKDMYLKQVNDITLNEGWKSIGVLIDPSVGHINSGKNMNAFSGTLDGNGKTVTVPEGCEPLLGYVKGATVKNLNIYGKQIAGYGLVNHLEGVGLSGEAICIDNVTLKSGSSTLKSGLIGTYITNNGFAGCSAAFYVTIKNCTIEKDVVVGYNKDQSMIGSIAGRIHGTIDNCVSYATVYGKDYVGGILGTRDNAMGGCVVTNSQFHGTVVATGTQVGGIVGGGYSNSSAPNGAKINIIDCSVSGSITGADKVGGIVGSDIYVAQLWGAHSLKNNSFTGTVKATDGTSVGGIIGYYLSLNKYDDIAGNYYKAGCGADRGIGYVEYVDTSCETHETVVGGTYFNTADGVDECPTVTGCAWKTGLNRTDDPLGADAAKLCYTDSTPVTATELKVSGTYKTQYTTGDKLDLSGIVLTVVYTDKSEETIDLSDVTVTGYDANKVGEQELTISYNGLTATITVTVKNPAGTITVTVSVYGDSKHGAGGTVHTLAGGGLTTWASAKAYTVDSNSTVWDVLQKAFAANGITCNAGSNNSQGTVYISSLTRNGVTLSEFDNGSNSGWMYTLNGAHPENGVAQQYLKDGDKIIFHYTDDYTKEDGGSGDKENEDTEAIENVEKLIDAIGTVTLNSADEIAAARKAYDNLTYAQKQQVENYATLTAAEAKYAELKQADDEKKASAVEDLIDAIKEGSTTFEDDVKAAQKAYNNLTADQKKLVDNYYKLTNALKELADEEDKEAAEAVEKLIEDLGTVTLDSEEDIKAARDAYDALTAEQKALVGNLAVLEAAEERIAELKALADVENIYKTTGDYLENLGTPGVGSVGGEWMVIGLTRSGREIKDLDAYYEVAVQYVQENIDEDERLHRAKSTDNARMILALTALGKNVTDVGGHNLLNGLNDMAFIQKQGINGPIWALIAFDSGNYSVPEGDVSRQALIQVILDAQLADGGWALSGEVSDADLTGMAVQALAPYYETNADVKKALDEAIKTMSKMQNADGSYGSIDGTSSESIAQIIVALAALGIDADMDARFIKNGVSALDALCVFYVEGGGFKHLMDGNLDGMATEQGYYALTAYFRMQEGKNSLYNMCDVIDMGGDVAAEEPTDTLPVETEPVETEPVQVEDEEKGSFPWWILIVILVAGTVVVVIMNRKKIFANVR